MALIIAAILLLPNCSTWRCDEMEKNIENCLMDYVDAQRPIIYINHFDGTVIDKALKHIGRGTHIHEYNNALGAISFEDKHLMEECSLEQFLRMAGDNGYGENTFILLKDVHPYLTDPKIIALLKRIAEDTMYRDGYSCTVFIVSPKLVIPIELENYITVFDMPLPDFEKIGSIIDEFALKEKIIIEDNVKNTIALSLKGLYEFQIRQILNLAYQNSGCIDAEDKLLILEEREQLIKKNGILEIVNYSENMDDIGGLSKLKKWLERKAVIFNDFDCAKSFHIDMPKGVMIIGVPGCGKSLTAKVAAKRFGIPLVRLDIGRLLGKYVGESEQNMRKALKLSEAISPCVLWIDEIEKAFAGIGNNNSHEVTTRLFGQFLTWMQEKESKVFIVATANDISSLPPEFLRKGRFDELFFVDLPDDAERRQILEIHLRKREQWSSSIDIGKLSEATKGFNGADIEAVVKNTIELAFIRSREENTTIKGGTAITTNDLLQVIKDTKSISRILKGKIDRIRNTVKEMDIKRANTDEIDGICDSVKEAYPWDWEE